MGLLDWLQRYTFPMEKSLANDDSKATDAYERVVQSTLAWGTTSAAYYATIGRRTTEILCDVAEKLGIHVIKLFVSLLRH
jgi:guanine deaminase